MAGSLSHKGGGELKEGLHLSQKSGYFFEDFPKAVENFVMRNQDITMNHTSDVKAVIEEAATKHPPIIARWLLRAQGFLSRLGHDTDSLYGGTAAVRRPLKGRRQEFCLAEDLYFRIHSNKI